MSLDKMNLATVEMMWRREVEAAATYKHLAEREPDHRRKEILMRLAEQEDKHAARVLTWQGTPIYKANTHA